MNEPSIPNLKKPRPGPWHGVRTAGMLLKQTAVEWWKDQTFRYAAALAFYTLFSIGPVVLIATGAASFFFVTSEVERNIVLHVGQLVGWEGARAVQQVIEASGGMGKSAWAVIVGGVTFILGASVVFGELQSALNTIWDVRPDRRKGTIFKIVTDRLRSFGIALSVGFLLVISLVVSAAIGGLRAYATSRLPGMDWLWQAADLAASFAVVVVLFAMIYKFLPDVRLGWRDVWLGAAVTAVLFIVGKYGIGVYLGRTAIAGTYGAAGSLAVLLVWVYYAALICFYGAEFTQVHAKYRAKTIKPEARVVRAGRK